MHIIGNGVIGEELVTSFKNKKKNLLQGVIWLKGFINQSGTVEENATYKNAMYTEQYIKINSKKTYSANFDITDCRMRCYSNSKEFIGTALTLNKFPTNTVYIRIVALYGIPSEKLIIKEMQTDEANRNLLVNADKYDPYVFKGTGDGSSETFTFLTDMYAYLKKGEQYTFSCNVDGKWGSKAGEDTVEVWLFKDKNMVIDGHNNGGHFTKSGENKFTLTADTGNYYIRIDNNSNNTTHTWSDFRISKVKEDKHIDFIGLDIGKIYKFNNVIKNLIDLTKYSCKGANSNYEYDYNLKQYAITPIEDNKKSGLLKDYEVVCEYGSVYTIGYKIKAPANITYVILLDYYNTWNNITTFTDTITSNGEWVEIKKSFVAKKDSYRFIFGSNNYPKGSSFYVKDMFLIRGDYTNKKIPDRLFK